MAGCDATTSTSVPAQNTLHPSTVDTPLSYLDTNPTCHVKAAQVATRNAADAAQQTVVHNSLVRGGRYVHDTPQAAAGERRAPRLGDGHTEKSLAARQATEDVQRTREREGVQRVVSDRRKQGVHSKI